MNTTVAGLLTGLALGFAGYFGGFGAFIVVAVMGLAGLIVGYLARGGVHIGDYVHTRDSDGRRESLTGHRSSPAPSPAPRTPDRTRVR